MSAGTFDRALELIDGWIAPQGVVGAAAVVWSRGGIVAERYAGEARPGVPVTAETMFALASVTKPVAAAVVMSLVEEGLVSLDESVVRFVPEFASGPESGGEGVDPALEAQRRFVTVRHLLAHTAGLPEDLAPGRLRYIEKHDLPTMTDAMCRLPLRTAPGSEHLYSNAGFAVLGRLVERVTGADFWDEARRRVLDPLGMRDTVGRPDDSLDARIARVADTAHVGSDVEAYNSPYWRGLGLPWGGMYGSARDLATFAGAFLPNGPRLLSSASVAMMTSDQALGARGGVQSMKVVWNPAFWGLGWEVKGGKRRHWTGDLTSPRTFCHFGAAGTLLWADPERDLALAVFGNRTTIHLWPFIPGRWARLSNALVAASGA
ncbi:MAG: serine hydrolase domain-containing protein [Thermomicrobiales bacterium]